MSRTYRWWNRWIITIECGDHIPKKGKKYPRDLLIRWHRHCCSGWDRKEYCCE